MTDATYSSEDDDECGDGDGEAYPLGVDGERVGKGVTKGVALNNLVCHAEGDGDEYGKEHSHPFAMQSVLHIISRTAIERVLTPALV